MLQRFVVATVLGLFVWAIGAPWWAGALAAAAVGFVHFLLGRPAPGGRQP